MTGETAQSLQAVSQAGFFHQHQMPFPAPGIGDPGPSSHPRGPPNLGQLSAIAAAAGQTPPVPHTQDGGEDLSDTDGGEKPSIAPQSGPATSGRSRASRSAAMGTDEWTRQRKDNHVSIPHKFCYVLPIDNFLRKKSNVDAEEILTRASTNSAASYQTALAKRRKAQFFSVPCSISTI